MLKRSSRIFPTSSSTRYGTTQYWTR